MATAANTMSQAAIRSLITAVEAVHAYHLFLNSQWKKDRFSFLTAFCVYITEKCYGAALRIRRQEVHTTFYVAKLLCLTKKGRLFLTY